MKSQPSGFVLAQMRRAIELARSQNPHPNPRVGAVVLDADGRVSGEGAHASPGTRHAEVIALDAAGKAARGGTLIVTLEPCSHHGRTPPCTEAILSSGVSAVVFGAVDPDQRVSGSGAARLETAGVEVLSGVLAAEVEAADPAYFHHRRMGRPLVTLKVAMTIDGQTAAADLTSQWITGKEAREDAHRLRASFDAVMVGSGTLLADDPTLDVRLEEYGGPQPRPIVLAGRRPLPPDSRIRARNPLVIGTSPKEWGEVEIVPSGPDGLPDLEAALRVIGEHGILDVLVEGGPTIAAGLWRMGLIDRGVVYLAGRIAGGQGLGVFDAVWSTLDESREVEITGVTQWGPDVRVEWRIVNAPPTTHSPPPTP